MKLKLGKAIVILSLFSPAIRAQGDVAGKWIGEQKFRGRVEQVVLEMMVSGVKLTGSMAAGEHSPEPLSDGRVDGSKVTFRTKVFFEAANGKIEELFIGEIKGDELRLTRQSRGVQGPLLILKRVK